MSAEKSDTFFKLRDRLGSELFEKAGIFRDKKGLVELATSIKAIQSSFDRLTLYDKSWLVSHLKFKNSLEVACALVLSANSREESRGAHYRKDFKMRVLVKGATYEVPLKDTTLLNALIHIRKNIDPTLKLRYNCKSGVCGRCSLRVNNQETLACEYFDPTPQATFEDDFGLNPSF